MNRFIQHVIATTIISVTLIGEGFCYPSGNLERDLSYLGEQTKEFGLLTKSAAYTGKSIALARSTMGMSGSSRTASVQGRFLYISQSIGQTSVIGTYTKDSYIIRQGFQQPPGTIVFINTNQENTFQARIYPNPFHTSVTIAFDTIIDGNYTLKIADITGRIVLIKILPPVQQIDIPLEHLSNGLYQLTVISKDKQFKATIIKH